MFDITANCNYQHGWYLSRGLPFLKEVGNFHAVIPLFLTVSDLSFEHFDALCTNFPLNFIFSLLPFSLFIILVNPSFLENLWSHWVQFSSNYWKLSPTWHPLWESVNFGCHPPRNSSAYLSTYIFIKPSIYVIWPYLSLFSFRIICMWWNLGTPPPSGWKVDTI